MAVDQLDPASHLATLQLGARVVARARLFYAGGEIEIPPGMLGTIEVLEEGGELVGVRWDSEKEALATYFGSLEVLP